MTILTDVCWENLQYQSSSEDFGVQATAKTEENDPEKPVVLWNPNAGQAEFVGLPQTLGADRVNRWANMLLAQEHVVRLATVVCQRSHHHPSQAGLVAKKLVTTENVLDRALTRATAGHRSRYLTLDPPAPETEDGTWGWFAPDADPARFGALYIHAGRTTYYKNFWELRQVGVEDELANAAWDDVFTLDELYIQALENEGEEALIVSSLLAPENLKQDAYDHRITREMPAAREAFSRQKDRVKPRVVANVLSAALEPSPETLEAFLELNEANLAVAISEIPLLGYSPVGTDPSNIHAGCRVYLKSNNYYSSNPTVRKSDVSQKVWSALSRKIETLLEEKGLGLSILKASIEGEDSQTSLWVVKNVEKARLYANAIHASSASSQRWYMAFSPHKELVATLDLWDSEKSEWIPLVLENPLDEITQD